MVSIFRIALILALFFAATFLALKFTGFFSIEAIESYLEQAQQTETRFLFLLVVLLLFSDLFIAVPTLTITILSGYFLGFVTGGLAAIIGMLLAGIAGYGISWRYGEFLLKKIVRSETKRQEAIASFNRYGTGMILLSRVSPILPEVSACLAGIVRMPFPMFFLTWSVNTIPYGLIAAYSGSVSSLNDPKPAIYAAIGLYFSLWLAWFLFRRHIRPGK